VSRAKRIIGNQLEHCDDIVGVYIMSSEARIPIEVMREKLNLSDVTVVVHERTPFSETALKNDQIDAIIAQNPGHAVRSALRILRARSEAREPNSAQESIRIEILLDENL
ncbi:MAG: LacI family transcriptional regulator, partial [Lentilitoribacter sp.]